MGLFKSKPFQKEPRDSIPPNQMQKCDDVNVNRLRKELEEKPEMFLLNNILLSVQFYENFEREMEELRKNQVSEREIELNKELAKYQKHCLLPDTVMEGVNERVRFRPYHGPKKFESESLMHQRMFIVHDNVEILYEGETSEYSTVDGPVHKAVLERALNPGYVHLRQKEFLDVGKNEDEMNSDEENEESHSPKEEIPSTPKESKDSPTKEKSVTFATAELSPPAGKRLYQKNLPSPGLKENQFIFLENPQEPKRPSEQKRSSLKNKILRTHSFTFNSSPKLSKKKESVSVDNIQQEVEATPKPDEQDYGYTTLRRITASKPLDEIRSHRNVSGITGIPAYCIKEIKERKILNDDESDSDDSFTEDGRRKPPKRKKIQDFYEIKKYFNSNEFVAHFGDVYETLYPVLGFTKESFINAIVQRGKLYSEGIDKKGNKIMYEIIPTVATAWPHIAYEWPIRVRPEIIHPVTKILYQWPTTLMIKKIRTLQANVLPVGFVAKRGINENQELEWSLSFPAAERYMETCMSHSQVRCYLFILALYKTFMQPGSSKLGLLPHHILNLIFWECEKNYITWPEEKLGVKLIKILNLLYNHLSKGHLPDYFVRERNLFESLPRKYLSISQSRLHDIIERPVPHMITALRNLRYTNGNFFPPLNFKSLYSILTQTNSLALLNPSLAIMTVNNIEDELMEEANEFQENETPFWNNVQKNEDRELKWKRNLRKQIDMQKNLEKMQNLKEVRKVSVDSIDLQIQLPHFDPYRKRCILEFFIQHFIDIATKCFQYEAYNHAIIILEHSLSLAILLGEEPSGELEARKYKRTVNEHLDRCRHEQQEQALKQAETNNRESRNFTGVRFLENSNLNLGNLQNAFVQNQDEVVVIPRVIQKKKKPQNLTIHADVHHHNSDISSPAKTPSAKSIQLEEDDGLNECTEL